MNWIALQQPEQLDAIKEKSKLRAQVIFKHSTRCSTSQLIKNRLERNAVPADIDFYYVDLISNRAVSSSIAETFRVDHESPQVLLIKNGECIYDESHLGIDMNELIERSSVN